MSRVELDTSSELNSKNQVVALLAIETDIINKNSLACPTVQTPPVISPVVSLGETKASTNPITETLNPSLNVTVPPVSPGISSVTGVVELPTLKLIEQYYDDFMNDDSGWDNYSGQKGTTGYENSRYFVELSQDLLFLSIWSVPEKVNEGVLQVDALSPWKDNKNGAVGLGFGWDKTWQSTYAFTIQPDGTCRFLYGASPQFWLPQATGKIEGFYNQKDVYTIQVHIKDGEATGYIDSIFCASNTIPDYEPGFIGVVAGLSPLNLEGQPQSYGKFYFDNYKMFSEIE